MVTLGNNRHFYYINNNSSVDCLLPDHALSLPMHWRLITVGKPGHPWVKEAMSLYWKRLQHYARFEHCMIKEAAQPQVEAQIAAACEGSLCVLLDGRGKQLRSIEMAKWIEKEEISGRKRICLVVGGAEGHSPQLRASAAACWSLSTLTLQHDIALVVLVEQLYRAYSITRGEPYHRE